MSCVLTGEEVETNISAIKSLLREAKTLALQIPASSCWRLLPVYTCGKHLNQLGGGSLSPRDGGVVTLACA